MLSFIFYNTRRIKIREGRGEEGEGRGEEEREKRREERSSRSGQLLGHSPTSSLNCVWDKGREGEEKNRRGREEKKMPGQQSDGQLEQGAT